MGRFLLLGILNLYLMKIPQSAIFYQTIQHMKTDKSPHILNASSNLLGICFVVLTSLKLLKVSDTTIIDELTAFTILALMASSIFSFLALRSESNRAKYYERIADTIFLIGLIFRSSHNCIQQVRPILRVFSLQ